MRRVPTVTAGVALLGATLLAGGLGPARATTHPTHNKPTVISANDWPMYGHDAQRTFHPSTTLTPLDAQTLVTKWSFPTGDAVTAEPVVVAGTVYVGSWDGQFYALDAAHGTLRWKYTVDAQPAIFPPVAGRTVSTFQRSLESDGGIITSTATFVPGSGARPDLVVFGAGYTLYALRATPGPLAAGTSRLYWKHAYTGRPEKPPNPAHDQTRIFSSPLVVGNQVLFGTSTDGERGERGYFISADLSTGNPKWIFQTDVDTSGRVLNDGCSGVWASPTLDRADGLVFFGVADCNGFNPLPYSGRLVALHVSDGHLAWVFTPARLDNADPSCDFDIGASANYGKLPNGTAFLGVGSKDGTYYSIDPRTGHRRWATNVVFGGVAGGFIGTAAFDGRHIYAATAIGDLPQPCENNLRDLQVEEPSIHALSATGGAVLWQGALAASFSPTTLAGGMVFSGTVLYHLLEIHDASTGQLLRAIPLLADTVSGVVVSGHTVFIGTGDNFQGSPGGIQALTPAAHLLDG